MEELLMYFLRPLVLTIFIEVGMAFALGIHTKKDALLVCLVNVITNPVVVFLLILLEEMVGWIASRLLVYAIVEPLVVIVEWRYYRKYLTKPDHPFRLSLVLNLCSIIGGIIWFCLKWYLY